MVFDIKLVGNYKIAKSLFLTSVTMRSVFVLGLYAYLSQCMKKAQELTTVNFSDFTSFTILNVAVIHLFIKCRLSNKLISKLILMTHQQTKCHLPTLFSYGQQGSPVLL